LYYFYLFFAETSANQLDVAKKYGKRFGNKNKSNTTSDAKVRNFLINFIRGSVFKISTNL